MVRNSAFIMIAAAVALLSLGLVMLTSVSAFAPANQGNPAFFITRQAVWLGIGIVGCCVAAQIHYSIWIKYAWPMLGISSVLMLMCFVPGIGLEIKGAYRWLDLGLMRLQPMEPFKISIVAFLAFWLSKYHQKISSLKYGLLFPLGIVGLLLGLCILQEDLGSAALIFGVTVLMLFVAGTKFRYLLPLPVAGFFALITLAYTQPQKWNRILAFLDPEKYKDGSGWQLWHALIAFGSGGVNGRGLGESIQKMKYLPESHTDFIFPIIGEELGLICTLGVVFCLLIFCMSAGLISCHAPEISGVLLGLGITALIGLQAMLNISVVTGLVPTTGIGLPFISYGGSNLLMCMGAIGILLNIHRNAVYTTKQVRRGYLPPVIPERS